MVEGPVLDENKVGVSPKTVADILCVNPKTVSRWCNQGKIAYFRTAGGHRRIYLSEIKRIERVKEMGLNGLKKWG
jgi:excisionase family DNA binding protein